MEVPPACTSCSAALSSVFSVACGTCGERHHWGCGVEASLEPATAEDVRSAGRRAMCKRCAWGLVRGRVERSAYFETPGSHLSLKMRVVLLGVERFFLFLGLAENNDVADYRRDREQAVFTLYKRMPAVLVGGTSRRNGCVAVHLAPPGMQPLSVFLPPTAPVLDPDGCVTVVIAFHGGAFVMGAHDSPAVVTLLTEMVRATRVVAISANYRKAPEHLFPTWNNDASLAVAFAVDQLPYLDFFPACAGFKIVVLGDSAGGNIACATAHSHRKHVAHGLYLYPILNLAAFDTESWQRLGDPARHLLLTRPLAVAQCGHLFKEPEHARLPLASPLLETEWDGVPSCHLMVGGFDPLLDDSKGYYSLCKAHDVPCSMSVYSTAPHGWLSFPQSSVEKSEGLEEMNEVVRHWATRCTSPVSKRLI